MGSVQYILGDLLTTAAFILCNAFGIKSILSLTLSTCNVIHMQHGFA